MNNTAVENKHQINKSMKTTNNHITCNTPQILNYCPKKYVLFFVQTAHSKHIK